MRRPHSSESRYRKSQARMAERQRSEVINFAPGPAAMPVEVIEEAQRGAWNYKGTGIGVMETSHRSPEYARLNEDTQDRLRRLINIPDDYSVLFVQGGGTAQFAAIPLNITGSNEAVADYLVTGQWSNKAAKEAEQYLKVNRAFPKLDQYTSIPDPSLWKLSPNAAYVYYCANETVHGVEFPYVPDTGDVPLVCDISSNFLTQQVDVRKFGVLYAGVQKNAGCSGVTVVVVRKDLLGKARSICPSVLNYTVLDSTKSNYNTPPVWSIYILNLTLQWAEKQGGIEAMSLRSAAKSGVVLDVINSSSGFYHLPVHSQFRSRVNIPFRIMQDGKSCEDLEAEFLKQASERGLMSLKGHRSVGGLRASLYNAISEENTRTLATFMFDFLKQHQK